MHFWKLRVEEGGVFHHELASRAAAEVGGDVEWFHGCRKRRKPGSEAAGEGENGRGDRGDCHGMGSTTKAVAGPGSQAWAIRMISLGIWKVANKALLHLASALIAYRAARRRGGHRF